MNSDGCYQTTFVDPQARDFWSATVYNGDGYLFNDFANISSETNPEKNSDGTFTLRFGCDGQPNNISIREGNKTGKFNFSSKQQDLEKALNADNKQAISTLYEIGYNNKIKIENKYSDNDAVLNYLNSLNWKRPWDAGAQFSSICVYSETQNFNFTEILEPFILTKLNIETGSYHDSGLKNTREIINGAMKVISGLDWLGVQIHDPKKLIDFCIDNKPHIEGCDVVDYVYVLYKCIKQDNHRRKEVQVLFLELLEEIMKLYNHSDKGFSYFENKSQTHYYGVKISKGLDVADLHGTTLCIWAINMILESKKTNTKNTYTK